MEDKVKCEWCLGDPIYEQYHDLEWGVPVHDDRMLFEMLILEGAQAGLSWITVLKKREGYRLLFDNFNAEKIIGYQEDKIVELIADPRIIRNKLKIRSVVKNAKVYLRLQEKYGSFDQYIWQFTNGDTIRNSFHSMTEVPAKTNESDTMSKSLKKEGMSFVGSTICYAFMQACGMVNDHTTSCFRYSEV